MTGYGLDDDDDDEYDDYDGSDTEGGDLLNRQKPARKSVTWADPIDDGGEGGPTAVATAAVAGAEVAPRADGGDRAAGAVVVAVAEAPSSSASGREVVDEAGLGFQIGAVHLLKKQQEKREREEKRQRFRQQVIEQQRDFRRALERKHD
ncbi:unnamed protein product [Ascophyllum nodosum]